MLYPAVTAAVVEDEAAAAVTEQPFAAAIKGAIHGPPAAITMIDFLRSKHFGLMLFCAGTASPYRDQYGF